MPESYRALSVAIDEDLEPLAAVLTRHGVRHRIFEEGGRQVVVVARAEHAEQVRALYAAWRAGEVRIEPVPETAANRVDAGVPWTGAPVILSLILLSVAGFALVYLGAPVSWIGYLTFNPFSLADGQVEFHAVDGQYGRLVTPVFLHFGWLHIVFNCLWLWELGRRVEGVMGHFNMFMLFLVIAVVSNASQYVFGGPGLFGGMSGVVYGLLGFSWVGPLLQPAWPIQPSRAIMLLMVGWLVFCMVGVVEVLGFGAIANAAHLGGLLCGAALGAVFGALSRSGGDKPRVPPV
jgi:GlpG protein